MNALYPHELTTRPQWVCFKLETKQDKLTKKPYNARTRRHAMSNDASTWASFQEAVDASYDCIGYAICEQDSIRAVDLDKCREKATGQIEPWARKIIARLDSYTEVSPSGTGVHIYVHADVTRPVLEQEIGTGKVELYTAHHFITVTSNHLDGTPSTIEERTDALQSLYDELLPTIQKTPCSASQDALEDVDLDAARAWLEQYAVKHPLSNRSRFFQRLVTATFFKYGESVVKALAEDIDTLSGGKYGNKRIEEELERSLQKAQQLPRKETHKQAECTLHHHAWQDKQETKEERHAYLAAVGQGIKARVQEHLDHERDTLLVITTPPGVGKSRSVAALGNEGYNVAWIAARHEMRNSVPALQAYRHIKGCNKENCEYYIAHNELARRGYPTVLVHKLHTITCEYLKQIDTNTSSLYQLGHVETEHPTHHQGIIVDEFDISTWIDEREISQIALEKTRQSLGMLFGADYELLDATEKAITTAEKRKQPMHGKELFDLLNTYARGQLVAYLDELAHNKEATRERPFTYLQEGTPDEVAQQALEKHSVVLPHLVKALRSELARWQTVQAWNSCLEIKLGKHGYSLFVSEPKQFTSKRSTVPPMTILDATADKTLLSLLFSGKNAVVEHTAVEPPPCMQHIAVRTGKRYGKRALCTRRKDGTRPELDRVIAECHYLLEKVDPQHIKSVGLISYMGCIDELGTALNIPETRRLHFWNARGSNALEDCEVLFVVGTPTLRPDEVTQLARVLYRNDERAIDETSTENDGVRSYQDERLQHLAEYLIYSELTQCAHRNRPLRHDGRIVVTLCLGAIGDLPATETYSALPQLASTGQERGTMKEQSDTQRLEDAVARLQEQGKKVTVRALTETTKIRTATAGLWLKQHRCAASENKNVSQNPINTILIGKRETFSEQQSNDTPVLPDHDPRPDKAMQGPIDGPPPRPCIRCGTQAWTPYYDGDYSFWTYRCTTCFPDVAKQSA